jgi:hypothetical protein
MRRERTHARAFERAAAAENAKVECYAIAGAFEKRMDRCGLSRWKRLLGVLERRDESVLESLARRRGRGRHRWRRLVGSEHRRNDRRLDERWLERLEQWRRRHGRHGDRWYDG